MGDAWRELGDELDNYGDAFAQVLEEGLRQVAQAAIPEVRSEWPVATGNSRDSWLARDVPGGAQIVCTADYSSYVFARGDEERMPIYPARVHQAIQRAVDQVGLPVQADDLTEEYFGQGRTTAHLTGRAKKMIIHTPAKQAAAWRANYPDLITTVEILWNGQLQQMELVPADTIQGGQAGSRSFFPGGRRG